MDNSIKHLQEPAIPDQKAVTFHPPLHASSSLCRVKLDLCVFNEVQQDFPVKHFVFLRLRRQHAAQRSLKTGITEQEDVRRVQPENKPG